MTTSTITSSLRRVIVAGLMAGAVATGAATLGHLATADARPNTGPVTIPSDGPANCAASGGVWVWDGFEQGHCERPILLLHGPSRSAL